MPPIWRVPARWKIRFGVTEFLLGGSIAARECWMVRMGRRRRCAAIRWCSCLEGRHSPLKRAIVASLDMLEQTATSHRHVAYLGGTATAGAVRLLSSNS